MTRIATFAGASLDVSRPSIWKQVHEIRSNDTRLGSLTFTKLLRREAVAECDEGSWTIGQEGVWKPNVYVKKTDSGESVVEFPVRLFKHTFTFTLPGRARETVSLNRNFLATTFSLTGAMNRPLASLTLKPFALSSGTLTIGPRAGDYEELPWLVFLLWYYGIMTRKSRSHSH